MEHYQGSNHLEWRQPLGRAWQIASLPCPADDPDRMTGDGTAPASSMCQERDVGGGELGGVQAVIKDFIQKVSFAPALTQPGMQQP